MEEVDVQPESTVGGDEGANCQVEEDDDIIFDRIVIHSGMHLPRSTFKALNFEPRTGGPTFERPDQLYRRKMTPRRRARERTNKSLEASSGLVTHFRSVCTGPHNDEEDEVTFLPPTATSYTQTFDFPVYQEHPPAVLDEQNDSHSFNSQPTTSPDYSSLSTNSNQSDVITEELTKSMGDQSFCDLDSTPQPQNERDEPAINIGEDAITTTPDTLQEDEQGHDFAGSKGAKNYDTQSSTDGVLNSGEHSSVIQNNCPEPMSASFEDDGASSFNFLGLNTTQPADKSLESESTDFGSLSDLLSGLPAGDSNDLCSVSDLLQMAESNWSFLPGGLDDIVTMCSNSKEEDDLNVVFPQQSHEPLSDPVDPVPQTETNKSSPETPPQPSKIKETMNYTDDDVEITVTPITIRFYRCCICWERDFSSETQLMEHIFDDHKISKQLKCEVVSCTEDEIDTEQKDVDRYEKETGRKVPGRVYLKKLKSAASEWQDLSDSDNSAEESVDITKSSSSSSSSSDDDDRDPDYVEGERRRRRCPRKKSSTRPKSQSKPKSVPTSDKRSAKREPVGRRLRQRPSRVTK
ncbi:uncharacterized protein LOC110858488 [Folsomia candida]|uniref:uncharacterized protein LOC110858488 n=1 Tax=Folsomia candida TaxID=158441 RepID=UPI000B8F5E33|nr:uncharacterized protein LOC110858488 [Folsomia candida]